MEKPLILISNDDGIGAKGLHALVNMVEDMGDIIVCAPDGPRSGRSRAFTTTELTTTPYPALDSDARPNVRHHVCTGTPVDCIKMAYGLLCPRRPALVLGGINHGDNASTNAHYSGTMGIAIEGCMKGIPSIAFSLCDYDADANFEPMRPIVRRFCREALEHGFPHYSCLNINVPKVSSYDDLRGIRFCRMAVGRWRAEVEPQVGKTDDTGNQIYRLTGFYKNDEPDGEDTDAWALRHDYVAVTPCTVDVTDHRFLQQLRERFKS